MRVLLPIFLTACATTTAPSPPRGGPRGLHASEHLEAARQHEEAGRAAGPTDVMGPSGSPTVWIRSWDTSSEQEQRAKVHRSKAAALHTAYEEACGTRPLAEVSVSPLRRHATSGWNTATGAILYLTPAAGPPDRLLADLQCHRAWMMLEPADMDDCPLDLPGLAIDARGEGDRITVSISVRDRKLVGELQRRVAHELESGQQLR